MSQLKKSTKKTDIQFLLNNTSTSVANPSASSSSTPSHAGGSSSSSRAGPSSSTGGGSALDPEAPFKCPKCAQTFKWKGNLKKHMQSVHHQNEGSGEICRICNKKFAFRDGLKRHVRFVNPVYIYLHIYLTL